jgi:DNA-binding MarR family transcriptional regulator
MSVPDGLRLALDAVRHAALQAAQSSPAAPDLRDWQLLAIDLEAALRGVDEGLADEAEILASELRSVVAMAARNPADQLAARPASRRVLLALQELGEGARLSKVKECSGHSSQHLSNILKALTAHGLVEIATDENDGRGRRLTLTPVGRRAINKEAGLTRSTHYRDRIMHEDTPSGETFRRYVRASTSELEMDS